MDPLATIDPADEAGKCQIQWFGLADVAALVRLAAPRIAPTIQTRETDRVGPDQARLRAATRLSARHCRPGSPETTCRSRRTSPACGGRCWRPCRAGPHSAHRTRRPWRSGPQTARSERPATTPALPADPTPAGPSRATHSLRALPLRFFRLEPLPHARRASDGRQCDRKDQSRRVANVLRYSRRPSVLPREERWTVLHHLAPFSYNNTRLCPHPIDRMSTSPSPSMSAVRAPS